MYNTKDDEDLQVKGKYIHKFKEEFLVKKDNPPNHAGYPSKRLRTVYNRDKGICHLCLGTVPWYEKWNRRPDRPTVDHVIPRSQRPRINGNPDRRNSIAYNSAANLKLAHYKCNHERGSMTVEEFRSKY